MFAKIKTPFVAALISVVAASMCFAQQTPSQRFSPERNVPPSVHVPTNGAKRLPSAPNVRPNNSPGTSFNFSDTPTSSFQNRNRPQTNDNPNARLVSYDEKIKQQQGSKIPEVLRGKGQQNESLIHSLRPPKADQATQSSFNREIVVDQSHFQNQQVEQQKMNARIEQLKKLQQFAERQTSNQQSTEKNLTRPPAATENANVHQVAFQEQGAATTTPVQTAGTAPSSVGRPVIARAFEQQETMRSESGIRNVSAESEIIKRAAVNMINPGIRVQAFGPDAIGINKVATYKVTVTNDDNYDAEQIQVGVGIPADIELQNINVSTGHHDITDGVEHSRLVWTIERVPANTTHTIAINLIPRSSQPFDMEVNWKYLPRTALTQIRVTEPKLEMKISGPTEVQFGEKATYDVTVINPGTGTAERVSVMLPEALGGEQANIGDVPAGGDKRFKVELFARTAGQLSLAATAVGDGDIRASANHDIMVRRANLSVAVNGPSMKYAGSVGQYTMTVSNDGDATASNVTAVFALPSGVKYLGGISNVQDSEGGLKWHVGTLTSGDSRTFTVNCQLDASGQLMFQAGARGAGDLAASGDCKTKVDTVADLTLDVEDPKGPLPTGENIGYKIVIRNRGTRSANGVDLVMQFSEGIEPVKADGFKHKIVTGQVIFAPITRIEPGQEVVLNVTAQALKSGTHIFRAQLTCEESDSREIGEGTTRFFGDDIASDAQQMNLPAKANTANAKDDNSFDFK